MKNKKTTNLYKNLRDHAANHWKMYILIKDEKYFIMIGCDKLLTLDEILFKTNNFIFTTNKPKFPYQMN